MNGSFYAEDILKKKKKEMASVIAIQGKLYQMKNIYISMVMNV